MTGASEHPLDVRRVVSADGTLLVLVCTEPVPVGTRVRVPPRSVGLLEPGAEPLRGKVTDVRRAADAYTVTVRLHSVTRAQREAIAAFV